MSSESELYTELLVAWQALGKQIQAVREALGVEVCPSCTSVIPEGFHHEMWNGNQIGMCVEAPGPSPYPPIPTLTFTDTPPSYIAGAPGDLPVSQGEGLHPFERSA